MTCLGNEDRINCYLDGELSPPEMEQFEEHLAGCQACQRELARARALFAVLDGLQEAPVPAGFGQEVLAGLRCQPASSLGRWILIAQVAATLVLLALAYPTLTAWYVRANAWFAPGWLSNQVAAAVAWARTMQAWLAGALTADLEQAWPPGFGLTWPQAAFIALALVGLWAVSNRLLFANQPNGTGGTP